VITVGSSHLNLSRNSRNTYSLCPNVIGYGYISVRVRHLVSWRHFLWNFDPILALTGISLCHEL
ncbi:MAG: hypothetical protein V7L25_09080, partial [Nostoc sp.]|uniref:hypothetical protein n=1 Tax=Nostoc sp. TaxID=1180 RepID=UPI002FF3DEAE